MAALRKVSDDDVTFLGVTTASSSSSSHSAGAAADGSGGGGGGGAPCVLIFPEGEEESIPEMAWTTPPDTGNVVLPWEGAAPPYTINTRSEALKTFNKLTGNVFEKLNQRYVLHPQTTRLFK